MNIHFIAIGGAAMHHLAIELQNKGHRVSGSDDAIYEPAYANLLKNHLLPEKNGWFPEKITSETEAIILGMHAKKDNPELRKALDLGLKIYSYPEFLYQECQDQTRVVIAGSHGKTTITAMVLHVLNFHQKETNYMVGATLEGFDCMVKLKESNDFMIMEGDEYLSSALDPRSKFLHYQPNIALISGIAWDHINVFPTFESYLESFRKFIHSITPGGVLVYNEEDENLVKLINEADNYFRKLPYRTPNYTPDQGNTYLDSEMGPIPLKVFGKHNLQNIEAARLISAQLGILEEDFYDAIMSFEGASKRLEKINRKDGAIIYRDFAHAPSKVKATADAFAEKFPHTHKIGFLELHTYSSLTPEFLPQYQNTLNNLDQAIVFLDAEALSLKNKTPISRETISRCFGKENLQVFFQTQELLAYWESLPKRDSAFLLMSSGNLGGLRLKD